MVIRSYILYFLILLSVVACNDNGKQQVPVIDSTTLQMDSIAKAPDSLVYADCYEKFFQGLQTLNDSAHVVLTLRNGKKVKFAHFAANDMGGKYARYGIKSLDGDTIPELIMYNYTGGAHCCDELYIFGREKEGYVYKSRLFGGFVCIDPATNVFTFSLNETLGYFFSCYACGFSDSTTDFKTIREIELQYAGGRLQLKRYDSATEKQLFRNLEVLKKHGYQEIEGELMDNGWRKEFAMNFAVWHYNNGKNWNSTKTIFDKYYSFPDSVSVWKEFYTSLRDTEKESSL